MDKSKQKTTIVLGGIWAVSLFLVVFALSANFGGYLASAIILAAISISLFISILVIYLRPASSAEGLGGFPSNKLDEGDSQNLRRQVSREAANSPIASLREVMPADDGEQAVLLIALESGRRDDPEDLDFMEVKEFVERTTEVLRNYIEIVLTSTKKGLNTVLKIDDMLDQMDNAFDSISDLKSLADSTKLIAINAAVEAAKNGEQAIGFAKVAQEVNKLSEHSESFGRSIIEEVGTAKESVNQAKSMVTKVAEKEIAAAIACKSRLDNLLGKLSGLDQQMHACGESGVHPYYTLDLEDEATGENSKLKITNTFLHELSEEVLIELVGLITEVIEKVEKIISGQQLGEETKKELFDLVMELKQLEKAKIFLKKRAATLE